ncbi:Cytochrome B561 [Plasmodiophora brassicae]|uniref:Uncharacterized protein n=1 Tax=Plasmodiophora brassicae TaxID=37360 RepID=A0A3P3YN17_PLABS|nr:unnamed protein product [Plasmodiophora brassicae]
MEASSLSSPGMVRRRDGRIGETDAFARTGTGSAYPAPTAVRLSLLVAALVLLQCVRIGPDLLRLVGTAVVAMHLIVGVVQMLGGSSRRSAVAPDPFVAGRAAAAPSTPSSSTATAGSIISPGSRRSTPSRLDPYTASMTPPPFHAGSPQAKPKPAPEQADAGRWSGAAAPSSRRAIAGPTTTPQSSPYMQTYLPSVREESSSQLHCQAGQTANEFEEMALHDMAAGELRQLRVSPERMETLAERMRSFLAMDVLRPLCNELRASDASLFEIRDRLVASGMPVAMALSQCDPNNAVAVAKVLRDNLGSVPQVQGVLEVRRQLDEFLAVPRPDEDDLGSFPMDYVESRLFRLGEDTLISDFHWDSGMPYKGKAWSADTAPTDTQILLHVFSRWVDTQVLPRGSFSRAYVASVSRKTGVSRRALGPLVIEQTRAVPPYFVLVTNAGRKYHPLPGRHVVFNTLALFVFLIHKDHDGKVCRCSIASLAKSRTARLALQPGVSDDDDNDDDYT